MTSARAAAAWRGSATCVHQASWPALRALPTPPPAGGGRRVSATSTTSTPSSRSAAARRAM
jgi:hypothetical protein